MSIKWHKNILCLRKKRIEFSDDIQTANYFKKWLVVALPSKIYFLCHDEIIIPLEIESIEILNSCIIYQNRRDNSLYKLIHPYEKEQNLFYCHNFKFKFLHNQDIYVLEKDQRYFIKHKENLYQIFLNKEENSMKYTLKLITNQTYQESRKFDIFKYDDFIILIHNNSFTLSKFSEEQFLLETPIYLREKIKITKILKMKLDSKSIYFLQINNLVIYKNKFIYQFDETKYPESVKESKFLKNITRMFWNKPDELERKIISSLNDVSIFEVIKNCIENRKYDFSRLGVDRSVLDFLLENEYLKSKNIDDFYTKIKKYDFLENSKFYAKFNMLMSYNTCILKNPDFKSLLSIKYRRIFNFNQKFIDMHKPRNLAYLVIYYEQNRNANIKSAKRINLYKLFKKYLGDERMQETIKIFNEPVRIFDLDENDGEDVLEHNYVLRLSSNIGKSFCFYNNTFFIKELKSEETFKDLNFPLLKNDTVSNIEMKDKNWKQWPSFNYGCYQILSSKKRFNLKTLLSQNYTNEFLLSGIVFGLGLKNYFNKLEFTCLFEKFQNSKETVQIFIIIAFSISNIEKRNGEFEEFCYKNFYSDQSFDMKIAALISLSNIFRNTKNTKLQNILKIEIDRKGIFNSDKYNRNNVIVYDTTYNLICTINMAKIIGNTTTFINQKNKLCELILNGICLSDKKKYRTKFERFKGDPLNETFYSGVFLEEIDICNNKKQVLSPKVENLKIQEKDKFLIKFETRLLEIEKFYKTFTIWDVYKYAGIIFYYGITKKFSIKATYLELLLKIETETLENNGFKVLFDYLLITLTLFCNSSCNLEILKVIRRQIKKTETNTECGLKNNYIFTNLGIKKDKSSTTSIGDLERYKIILGILCLGLSNYEILDSKYTKVALITTFYVDWPVSPYDQQFINLFRYELFQCIGKRKNEGIKKYILTRLFKREFHKLSNIDKKYVIDILGDFYENYHKEEDYCIDINYIKDLIIRST